MPPRFYAGKSEKGVTTFGSSNVHRYVSETPDRKRGWILPQLQQELERIRAGTVEADLHFQIIKSMESQGKL